MTTRRVLLWDIYRFRPPMARRVGQLVPGMVLFGAALGLSVEANLGVNPWTVFHGGVSEQLGISIGLVVILTGLALLTLFAAVGEPLGLGTLLNVALIGVALDLTLAIVPDLTSLPVRIIALAVSPILLGLASGLYLGANLGPGPRDGLMTALTRRGLTVSKARTVIELSALAIGWLLGGNVGIGTVYFGLTVGWFVQFFLRHLRVD